MSREPLKVAINPDRPDRLLWIRTRKFADYCSVILIFFTPVTMSRSAT